MRRRESNRELRAVRAATLSESAALREAVKSAYPERMTPDDQAAEERGVDDDAEKPVPGIFGGGGQGR
jgi:hypothetical protein